MLQQTSLGSFAHGLDYSLGLVSRRESLGRGPILKALDLEGKIALQKDRMQILLLWGEDLSHSLLKPGCAFFRHPFPNVEPLFVKSKWPGKDLSRAEKENLPSSRAEAFLKSL